MFDKVAKITDTTFVWHAVQPVGTIELNTEEDSRDRLSIIRLARKAPYRMHDLEGIHVVTVYYAA